MDYAQIIKLVTEILHRKDPYNHHGANVGRLSVKVARLMSPAFTAEELEMIGHAANLHDMGKILLDDTLLNFPRLLTAAEYETIKTHTTHGFHLAQSLQYDPIIQGTILYHHENIDGSGYPHGLRGEQIPAYARIVRVVDVYDSITNHRAYRQADTRENAMKWLEAYSDRMFDREIVTLFKRVLSEKP